MDTENLVLAVLSALDELCFVGVDALIDPNQNITMRSRDDVGIVPYGVLSEVLGHLRGIATPVLRHWFAMTPFNRPAAN